LFLNLPAVPAMYAHTSGLFFPCKKNAFCKALSCAAQISSHGAKSFDSIANRNTARYLLSKRKIRWQVRKMKIFREAINDLKAEAENPVGSSAVLRVLNTEARARASSLKRLMVGATPELENAPSLIHVFCFLLSDPLPSQYDLPLRSLPNYGGHCTAISGTAAT